MKKHLRTSRSRGSIGSVPGDIKNGENNKVSKSLTSPTIRCNKI
jgi:hypothetical protein